ncbi:hypothetical protein CWI42_010620 [Ordospora colligata]|uniref:Uncharacterized protein n=1 Tax=Ordospora colligata OC4 TaxID=1354746 RepID=A0A0B2UN72_9MICR|nr:uncharacterized protein M896_010620 [Ordospora colligata OC4]KHN70410.1 hypothetical protein M896_010620 [Ordospora colligata OC4]TBU17160.1 hypothetical protein CWI41_010620 [Ordospora colligata]TBU17410.1 hypothetical protein CWI40_010620 [Ordospora colligata]TBU19590.1 hypothetical protein CWI42_010620 [Ordospora colligata]
MPDYENNHSKKINWGLSQILLIAVLYATSIACVFISIQPLLEMDFEPKNFIGIFIAFFHGSYMLGFMSIHKKSQFVFWASSYTLLCITTILLYCYNDLFLQSPAS